MSKAITSSRLATLPARISQHRTLTVSGTYNHKLSFLTPTTHMYIYSTHLPLQRQPPENIICAPSIDTPHLTLAFIIFFTQLNQPPPATANAAKQQFILIARDFKDPEAITRRLDTRTKHLAEARELKKSGQIHYAGALFSDHSDSGKMVGSVIVFQAENAEEVRKIVERYVVLSFSFSFFFFLRPCFFSNCPFFSPLCQIGLCGEGKKWRRKR
jgi:uncharacterized protein YciI